MIQSHFRAIFFYSQSKQGLQSDQGLGHVLMNSRRGLWLTKTDSSPNLSPALTTFFLFFFANGPHTMHGPSQVGKGGGGAFPSPGHRHPLRLLRRSETTSKFMCVVSNGASAQKFPKVPSLYFFPLFVSRLFKVALQIPRVFESTHRYPHRPLGVLAAGHWGRGDDLFRAGQYGPGWWLTTQTRKKSGFINPATNYFEEFLRHTLSQIPILRERKGNTNLYFLLFSSKRFFFIGEMFTVSQGKVLWCSLNTLLVHSSVFFLGFPFFCATFWSQPSAILTVSNLFGAKSAYGLRCLS